MDVAMATDFGVKSAKLAYLTFMHHTGVQKTDWSIAMPM